jgi:hypothetical protein
VSAKELVMACGQFYDAVIEKRIKIRRHARLDQAEKRGQLLAPVRMPGAEKAIGSDDCEAHRVVEAIGDAPGLALTRFGAEQPRVGRDEERAVLGVDPEAMHVDRPSVTDLRRVRIRPCRAAAVVVAAGGDDKRCGHQASQLRAAMTHCQRSPVPRPCGAGG